MRRPYLVPTGLPRAGVAAGLQAARHCAITFWINLEANSPFTLVEVLYNLGLGRAIRAYSVLKAGMNFHHEATVASSRCNCHGSESGTAAVRR